MPVGSENGRLAAIVLAGGQGTRMKSAVPKAAHLLLGRPLAAWPAGLARRLGASPIVVVVSRRGGHVERALGGFRPRAALSFAVQERPLGTADAVRAGLPATQGAEHVLILNGDVPLVRRDTLARLERAYRDSGGSLALLSCVLPDGASYGRILRDDGGRVLAIREARDASPAEKAAREVNVGVYLVRRELLEEALGRLDCRNAQGEFYLTDLVALLHAEGHTVAALPLEDPVEMQGVNTRAELAEAGRELVRRRLAGFRVAAGLRR